MNDMNKQRKVAYVMMLDSTKKKFDYKGNYHSKEVFDFIKKRYTQPYAVIVQMSNLLSWWTKDENTKYKLFK